MLKLDQITKKFHIGTPDETTLFNQFCFEVQKGEFVSIVGSNGSGKTTLLNIVCGSLPVEGGKVFFGGKDITRLSEYKRADQIGRVFQDPKKGTCDELTILENMALADNKHKAYGLSRGVNKRRTDYYRTLLETCGMGLEDRLNVKAGTLSGGQRQRLAMARALLHDTPIYLFDEATSNVDAESENDIMAAIRGLAGKKTVILISHRLANVVDSDCIYVLENGGIAEHGTHAQLLAQGGAYCRLYTAQKQLETLAKEDA